MEDAQELLNEVVGEQPAGEIVLEGVGVHRGLQGRLQHRRQPRQRNVVSGLRELAVGGVQEVDEEVAVV